MYTTWPLRGSLILYCCAFFGDAFCRCGLRHSLDMLLIAHGCNFVGVVSGGGCLQVFGVGFVFVWLLGLFTTWFRGAQSGVPAAQGVKGITT